MSAMYKFRVLIYDGTWFGALQEPCETIRASEMEFVKNIQSNDRFLLKLKRKVKRSGILPKTM